MSVRQRFYISSPASILKLLVESNCQKITWNSLNVSFVVTGRFANVSVSERPVRKRMKSICERSRLVRQDLYVSSSTLICRPPTSKLKLLVQNICQIQNLDSLNVSFLVTDRLANVSVRPTSISPRNEVDSPVFEHCSPTPICQFANV